MPKDKSGDLREACLQEALAIIDVAGVEGLSLREVARRLGVSHQAPYKHFASRDHLLAEIVGRAFVAFAQHLDNRPLSGNPQTDLRTMGMAYLEYALAHPLQYRLMFGTPLPDPDQHPTMMHSAQAAFRGLRDCIAQLHSEQGKDINAAAVDLDALYVWATMHGLASLLQTKAIHTLSLPPEMLQAMLAHTLACISTTLNANDPPP